MCIQPVPESWRGSVNMQRDLDMIQRVNRGKSVRSGVHTTFKDDDGKLQHTFGGAFTLDGEPSLSLPLGSLLKAEQARKKMTKTIQAGIGSIEAGVLNKPQQGNTGNIITD